MEEINLLSVVVPAYKQEKTIIRDINNIEKTLKALKCNYEVVVVVDGFIDGTYKKLKNLKRKRVSVYGYKKNWGKGYAVRYGVMRAKGDVVGFIDSGMEIDPTGIQMLLHHMNWYKADIIIGSKLHPVSQVNYPLYRKIVSWGYRSLVRVLFGLKVKDTQVGLKFFRKNVAKKVFPRMVVKEFAFDIEFLAVSNALGFTRIFEAPIKLNFLGMSSVTSKFWYVIFKMFWDTVAVFYRLQILRFYFHSNKWKPFTKQLPH